MEDYRDHFVVIVAGYPELMEDFYNQTQVYNLASTSAFHFKTILWRKCLKFFADYGLSLAESAKYLAGRIIAEKVRLDPVAFGNGRGVRNLLEQAISIQANRLSALPSTDNGRIQKSN
jgi:hypothetical protein